MVWTVKFSGAAEKTLGKLDPQSAKRIVTYLRERVADRDGPRTVGKPLHGALAGLWRYRVGDFRIICEIEDGQPLVLVATIGHRSDVYRR